MPVESQLMHCTRGLNGAMNATAAPCAFAASRSFQAFEATTDEPQRIDTTVSSLPGPATSMPTITGLTPSSSCSPGLARAASSLASEYSASSACVGNWPRTRDSKNADSSPYFQYISSTQ